MVSLSDLEPLWNYLIDRYHYLGYKVLVGAHLKYLVFSKQRVVAVLGWSSAVWKLAGRDKAIGWSMIQKKKFALVFLRTKKLCKTAGRPLKKRPLRRRIDALNWSVTLSSGVL